MVNATSGISRNVSSTLPQSSSEGFHPAGVHDKRLADTTAAIIHRVVSMRDADNRCLSGVEADRRLKNGFRLSVQVGRCFVNAQDLAAPEGKMNQDLALYQF